MQRLSIGNRRAAQIENDLLRVAITVEGGHVAEIRHLETDVNPLWSPPWPSIEPSSYDPEIHPGYGAHAEAKLLSGILGHNVCMDLFGAPSPEEAAAGIPVHGEAAVLPYEITGGPDWMESETTLPKAQLKFGRRISVSPGSSIVRFAERVENLSALDRPIAWTEHVTLGPPFLEPGQTRFQINCTRSKVIDAFFNDGQGRQQPGAEFDWPLCPLKDGTASDLRVFPSDAVSAGFTAHLMDPAAEQAWFAAWSPRTKVLFGYGWRRVDFPWLARWEENHLRTQAPWHGNGLTCGMEFGVSPFVESRREMVERGKLFGVPTYRWVPAQSSVTVEYGAFITTRDAPPLQVLWDGGERVSFEG